MNQLCGSTFVFALYAFFFFRQFVAAFRADADSFGVICQSAVGEQLSLRSNRLPQVIAYHYTKGGQPCYLFGIISLLSAQNHYDKMDNWLSRLSDKLEKLDVLFTEDCGGNSGI